ncbi:protein MGARP isoform X2 [Callorhinchus milii]|uniref:protein MGARP isoform X2 n=1 Tax=Callorhinchus milii TaxID=7868 RepID=UPI001C3F7B2D|nr:protein MGARP isoform X2 [Callorhinchus milii]
MYLCRTALHRLSPLAKPSSSSRLVRDVYKNPSIRQMASNSFPGGDSGEKMMYILVIGAACASAGYYTYRTIYTDKARYNNRVDSIMSEAKDKLTDENLSEEAKAATAELCDVEEPIDLAADAQPTEPPSEKAAPAKKEGETKSNSKDTAVPAAVSANEEASCTDSENCESAKAPLSEEVPSSVEENPESHDVAAQNKVQISEERLFSINEEFLLLTSTPPSDPEEPPTCISEETSEKVDTPSAEEVTSGVADPNIAASLVLLSSPPGKVTEETTETPEDPLAIEAPSTVEDGPGNQGVPADLVQDVKDAAPENAMEEAHLLLMSSQKRNEGRFHPIIELPLNTNNPNPKQHPVGMNFKALYTK